MTRSVLVTGGTNGIGLAIARRFAAQGDTVAVVGRDPNRLAAAQHDGLRAYRADLTVPTEVQGLAERLEGPVDVLVNNAGGNGSHDQAERAGLAGLAEEWESILRLNLLSSVLATAAIEDRLQPGGSVISVGSIGAEYGAGAYGPAKAALASWNISLAARLGPRGVTANVVSPGYVEGTEFFRGGIDPGRRERLVEATFDRRPATPGDIAASVTFLAGDGARHITGQTLHVNGGAHTTR